MTMTVWVTAGGGNQSKNINQTRSIIPTPPCDATDIWTWIWVLGSSACRSRHHSSTPRLLSPSPSTSPSLSGQVPVQTNVHPRWIRLVIRISLQCIVSSFFSMVALPSNFRQSSIIFMLYGNYIYTGWYCCLEMTCFLWKFGIFKLRFFEQGCLNAVVNTVWILLFSKFCAAGK